LTTESKAPEDWKATMARRRERVKAILEEEDAYVHVAMNYISGQMRSGDLCFRKDGTPDRRGNRERLVVKLNEALDGAMRINAKEWAGRTT
jgi:hypothetical protein